MKTIINILLIISILSCSSESNPNETEEQNCGIYEGNVILKTMIEIEDFAQCNYTEITGNLGIYDGNVQYPVTSLIALSSLKKIGGILSLNSLSVLSTLNGLHNIESVKLLSINYAQELEDVDAIDKLQTNYIEMGNNISLQNINGLDMNSEEMFTVAFYDNPVLANLNCFSNIKSIRNALIIENNDSLIDLSGFNNIETIGLDSSSSTCCGTLIIEDNDNLISFSGLNNLIQIKGNTIISNNFSIEDIDDLSNLETMDGDLTIRYNTYLNNLDGFQNLTSLDGDIKIHDNPLLRRFCGMQNLFLSNGHSGTYLVFNNPSNPTQSDILNAPPCN